MRRMGLRSCSGHRSWRGRFPVDRGGFVRVDEDVLEEEGSVRRGMFDGVDKVLNQGVEVVEESIRVIFNSEVSYSVFDKVSIGVGGSE